ncbi:unnamed protein product [Psylliodes chrysocephalus]|uniref:Uncharacterized protein n=1 Tax=Psylliodes chrysocephalus TaxID=3402493 RepID=A0A9P0GA70_9CUCU|nr:unnamed protein product [Psylliodes chrysocephala]
MIELLKSYTDKKSSLAREDAIRCIAIALADSNTFLLDPLLSLKPVGSLKEELIHDLLKIFVSEDLTVYLKFYKELVKVQGLNHERNLQKIRLFSFIQLPQSNPEISFVIIVKELQIKPVEVEFYY